MVLMILTNVGQLTTNIVARNISIARLNLVNPNNLLQTASDVASDVAKALGLSNGQTLSPPQQIKWGLYSHCAYYGNNNPVCTPHGFGQQFDPVKALTTDMGLTFTGGVNSFYENDKRISNLHEKSVAAFYLLFLGTIFAGVAFLITCLIHMSALVVAAFFAFLSFAILVCGAAIWTYIVHRFKDISSAPYVFDYGVSLWFAWTSVACTLFAIPALASGSLASRRRYYEEPYY